MAALRTGRGLFTTVLPALGAPARARRKAADLPRTMAAVRSRRHPVRTLSGTGPAAPGTALSPAATGSPALATVRGGRGMLAGRTAPPGLVLTGNPPVHPVCVGP